MNQVSKHDSDPRYRPDIDGLRAVAVFSVLFFHVGFGRFAGGYVGVDVFFVISGFLITRLIRDEIERDTFSFGKFYVRRARRLFPALVFTWTICCVAAFLLFSPEHFARFGGALLYSVLSVSNYYFWSESGYFDLDVIVKPLIHTWSLSVEEQFYFVWPAAFYALMTLRRRWLVPASLVTFGLASLFYSQQWLNSDPAGAFFLAPFRVVEFAIGALMVWIVERQPRDARVLEFLLLLGLTLIAFAVFGFDDATPFPGLYALVPCLGTALVIYSGTARYFGCLLRNRVAVGFGLISYSMYLVHWPAIVFYRYYRFDVLSLVEKLALCVAAIGAAALMYRFVEQPFRGRNPKRNTASGAAFGLGCVMLALFVSFTAANIWAGDGWSWRLPELDAAAESVPEIRETVTDFHRGLGEAVADGGSRAFALGAPPDQAKKKVLVLGDSHAEHLKTGMDYLGKKYGFSADYYVATGCPPIFGTYKIFGLGGIDNPPPRQELCRRQTVKWEKFIFENQYDYVVLASRWAWLYEPTQYEKYQIRNDYLVDRDEPVYSVEGSRETFKTKLVYTIETIVRSGAMPIVFSQVPNIGKNPDGCDNVPRYIINERALDRRCSGVSMAAAIARLKFTDEYIEEVTGRLHAYSVIPSRYFCDRKNDTCRGFAGKVRLYKDADHINEAGSMYLARAWEADPDFPFR